MRILGLLLVLGGCGTDSAYTGPLNRALGLAGYPGATDVNVIEEGDDTRVTFFAAASLEAVYSFFHSELGGLGWQRTDLETEADETEAEYAQGAQILEFELERKLDDTYELELDLGGDNAGYDEDNGDDGDNSGNNGNGGDDGGDDDGSGDDNGDDSSGDDHGGDDSGDNGSGDHGGDDSDDDDDDSDDNSSDDSDDHGGGDDNSGHGGDDGGGDNSD